MAGKADRQVFNDWESTSSLECLSKDPATATASPAPRRAPWACVVFWPFRSLLHRYRVYKLKAAVPRSWQTAFLRWGPISGLFCLLVALLSIIASFLVLQLSHGQRSAQWTWQPSTFIAIITAVANQAVRYAALQGIVTAWWSLAMRSSGATLLELHSAWTTGTGVWSALTAGKKTSIFAIVCVASTLVAIDGPLLQKASTIVSGSPPHQNVQLNFTIAPEIPTNITGFASWYENGTMITSGTSELSSNAMGMMLKDAPMQGYVSGCKNHCKATIRAPAMAITTCDYISDWIDYGHANNTAQTWPVSTSWTDPSLLPAPQGVDDFYNQQALATFLSLIEWQPDAKREALNVTTISTQYMNCGAPKSGAFVNAFNYTSCEVVSAIAEYDVEVQGTEILLPADVSRPRIVALADNTSPITPNLPNTTMYFALLGMVSDMQTSTSAMVRNNVHDTMFMYPATTGGTLPFLLEHEEYNECGRVYRDAHVDLMNMLNRFAFWIGLLSPAYLTAQKHGTTLVGAFDVGLGTSMQQSVVGSVSGTTEIFKTDLRWFAGAAALQLVCIVCIASVYWGWWRLGREVSFSPLEIANAFEAPSLADRNSNATGKQIALGPELRLRYGATGVLVTDDDGISHREGRMLAFADPAKVYRPLNHVRFD